ncbi:uncharacterized protein LOC108047499 [Drosophila rhopaloa]|uniref:Uncharacterized protein LOC108047499 n=1 Tax=Drosophila rhopaloa TaxID=1041015 RepID=A0A6P4EYF5_DRORH|nr:uncharacterized protein LOC108047499 [Drosophila rhopaloa]XP_016983186.1 uncharacterized protein LOC108047499 [Drosophila rhopaloa]
MHLMCERLSSVFAGVLVGLWYAKTFPEDDKGKDKGKEKDKKK